MKASDAVQRNWLDGLAIGVSLTCFVHCLALPILIASLPAWSSWLSFPEELHVWLLAFAAPFSLAVLGGAARRRRFAPLWLGVSGLALMGAGLAMEGMPSEPVVTSAGALLLGAGHVVNWRQRVAGLGRRNEVDGERT